MIKFIKISLMFILIKNCFSVTEYDDESFDESMQHRNTVTHEPSITNPLNDPFSRRTPSITTTTSHINNEWINLNSPYPIGLNVGVAHTNARYNNIPSYPRTSNADRADRNDTNPLTDNSGNSANCP